MDTRDRWLVCTAAVLGACLSVGAFKLAFSVSTPPPYRMSSTPVARHKPPQLVSQQDLADISFSSAVRPTPLPTHPKEIIGPSDDIRMLVTMPCLPVTDLKGISVPLTFDVGETLNFPVPDTAPVQSRGS